MLRRLWQVLVVVGLSGESNHFIDIWIMWLSCLFLLKQANKHRDHHVLAALFVFFIINILFALCCLLCEKMTKVKG